MFSYFQLHGTNAFSVRVSDSESDQEPESGAAMFSANHVDIIIIVVFSIHVWLRVFTNGRRGGVLDPHAADHRSITINNVKLVSFRQWTTCDVTMALRRGHIRYLKVSQSGSDQWHFTSSSSSLCFLISICSHLIFFRCARFSRPRVTSETLSSQPKDPLERWASLSDWLNRF